MDNDSRQEAIRRENFRQVNASLSLEGMEMDPESLALQERIIKGEISHQQAIDMAIKRALTGKHE